MVRLSLALLFVLLQLSCQKNSSLQINDWRGQGPLPPAPTHVELASSKFSTAGQSLELAQQTWKGVPIEGAYFKRIFRSQELQFVSWQVMDRIGLSLKSDVFWMRGNDSRALAKMKTLSTAQKPDTGSSGNSGSSGSSGARLVQLVEGPHLLIRTSPKIEPVWRGIFETRQGELVAIDLNKQLAEVYRSPVGSRLSDVAEVSAAVFPKGPLKSGLQVVTLPGLSGSRNLSSSRIRVCTRSEQEALAENDEFVYPVDDLRFHQVQVYFYIAQALKWFEKNLQFSLPFKLEVEMALGFPEKTNTAFYYSRKIRLGEGDDVVFSKIPLDPSVVTHEAIHAVEEAVAHLPYVGEGGSLNEAFADFFTATQFKNPNLGEASYKKGAFKRTVSNSLKLADMNGGLYHDSGIVSGLLWNLRAELGENKVNTLAWNILLRLTPGAKFLNFKTELVDLLSKENADFQKRANIILKERGWLE